MNKVSNGESKKPLLCSFCGKNQHEVRKLIAGPTVFICDECVELCMDIISEENKSSLVKSRDGVPTCVYRKLDSAVVVMKAAKDGRRHEAAHMLDGAMDRSVFVERPMSPQLVIVGGILCQNSA